MSSVLTPRPCRTPYSSSPKSSPTGPTTRTSVKNDAASEKWTADPPSMRSRSPNGVFTASKAIDPTTTRLMRSRRLAGLDCDAAARDGRRLDDRRGGLTEDDEAVDDLLEVCHVAHVRLHEVTVVAGHAMALDHLRRLAREVGHVHQLARRGPDPDDDRQRQSESAGIDVRLVGADDAVGLEALHPFGHGRRRQTYAATQFRERQARVGLQLGEDTAIRLIRLRNDGGSRDFPLFRSHMAKTTEGLPCTASAGYGTVQPCAGPFREHRRRPTSWSALSFTTWGRRSPCSCSRASACLASPGCASRPLRCCSRPGADPGALTCASTAAGADCCSCGEPRSP